ncbi:MAG: hypothetical protein JO061_18480, partial [Acidobacteriaceae bacterium]|nr:hypothetical protein [Acidobacteriaceae bacterium]
MKIITKLAHLSMTKVATTALAMLAIGSFANAAQSIFPVANTVSTVPSNGDVNPYGVAFVPDTVPVGHVLTPRDILISNFNNSANLQGLGTTITRVDRHGQTSTFYTSSSPQTGLTAALGILSNGWVLIGNLPTLDGTSNTVKPGSLAVLDADGKFLGRIGNLATVNGPWGMAVVDDGNGYIGVA